MTDLEKQVLDIVGKNLPSIQVESLKTYFAKHEETVKKLAAAETSLENVRVSNTQLIKEKCRLEETIRQGQNLNEYAAELKRREESVRAREIKQDVNDALLNAEKEKLGLLERFTNIVFRNTEIRKQTLGSTTKVTQDNDGYGTTHSCPMDKTETIEEN